MEISLTKAALKHPSGNGVGSSVEVGWAVAVGASGEGTGVIVTAAAGTTVRAIALEVDEDGTAADDEATWDAAGGRVFEVKRATAIQEQIAPIANKLPHPTWALPRIPLSQSSLGPASSR